jgi:hypothetical protein
VGIREQLNQKPAITTGVTIAIIVIAFAFILYQLIGGDGSTSVPTKQYYTTDDGKNLFSDDPAKVPPFDHEGKPAVRAMVFTCDARKTQFVAYLERMTPEAKAKLEAAEANKTPSPTDPMPDREMLLMEGVEVKKPNDTKWIKRASAEGSKITDVTCPSGGTLDVVTPD